MTERRSIAVFPFDRPRRRVLLLRRVAAKGAGWQPVTGRVEVEDAHEEAVRRCAALARGCVTAADVPPSPDRDALVVAALRELAEETGVVDVRAVVDLGLESRFVGYDGATYRERAFAVEVPGDVGVVLSDEHEEARWVGFDDAAGLLQWDENRVALARLADHLDARDEGSPRMHDAAHRAGNRRARPDR